MPLLVAKANNAKLLIDTGSDVTILKINHADDDAEVHTNNLIQLKGITENTITSLGLCIGNIPLSNNVTISHEFHIVPHDFPIPCHGILGKDFLVKYKAIIDYESLTISFPIHNETFTFHLSNPMSISVPPRCEYRTQVYIDSNIPKLCVQKEVKPGLFVANAIVQGKNNICTVNLVNSTENPISITSKDFEFDDLNNYELINVTTSVSRQRLDQLLSEIKTDHLNSEEFDSITKICKEFNDIFFLEGDTLSHTNAVEHKIPLTSKKPIFVKPYRLPHHQKLEIQNQLDKMLKDDIIENSNSPYNSPLLIVPKKADSQGNKRWRLVVDFRKLNDNTEADAYPLPNITEILDQLGNTKYFSVVDLATGFHQIPLCDMSKPLTAFSFSGHYHYKRMPMGLKGAPATFQRLMNNVLTGLQGVKCFVYLDDIVIYGNSLSDHNSKLIEIFSRLREHNLKLQPGKCEFLRKEITYLGHKISENGIMPDPSKISSVTNFPQPTNQKQVKSFLGLASYYRRFIENFSHIAQPLNNLLKKDAEFKWTALCDQSFSELKHKLTNPPILQFPDFSSDFILTTDASQYAIGAVLSQGIIGKDLPVAYASRSLNKAETNYSTIERELLAIVWAAQHFRPYLYGKRFRIYTDHRPLTYIFSISNPSSRLMRFRLKLEEYEYEVVYKPGKANTNADALSRILQLNKCTDNTQKELYEQYLRETENKVIINNQVRDSEENINACSPDSTVVFFTDSKLESDIQYHNKKSEIFEQNLEVGNVANLKADGRQFLYLVIKNHPTCRVDYETLFYVLNNLKSFCLKTEINSLAIPSHICKGNHIKVEVFRIMLRYIFRGTDVKITIFHNNVKQELSADEIQTILREYHITPLGGHQGVNRTYKRIRERYKWQKMFKDVKRFIKTCRSCQLNKCSKTTKMPMIITTTSTYPFEKIFLDIVGPLNQTNNFNKYLLTFQDDLSKFSIAIPIPDQEASTVARNFVTKIICQYGTPKTLLTDQGTNFLSQVFKESCKLLNIKQFQCTSYHPQSNGSLERSHRTLVEYLRTFINKDMNNWDDFIPFATFTYNTTPHTSTGFSPFELLYGRKAILPSALTKSPELLYNYDDYNNELKSRFQHCHEIARNTLMRHKEQSKAKYDDKTHNLSLKIGDNVLLKNETPTAGKTRKLQPLFKGPYKIVSLDSDVNCTIMVNRKPIKVHYNRLKKFNEPTISNSSLDHSV